MTNLTKKILITGGAGFIGYHLANHLLRKYPKARLVLVDNLLRGTTDKDLKRLIQHPRVKFLILDLTDPDAYGKLGGGYAHVYHLAAINGTKNFYQSPHETLRINTLSLIYMLEWFRRMNKNGKLCFTSSNEAYAGALAAFGKLPVPTPENVPLIIEDPYNPRWSYAASKLVGELFVIHYAAMYKLRALIVRPHNFYGPRGGYDHVIPEFCDRIFRRVSPFPIFGANDTRTFCYIEDAVRAMTLLMASKKTDGRPIQTVHIGDRRELSMASLARLMFDILEWHPRKTVIKKSPEGSVRRRLADIHKLQRLVSWAPAMSLEEGLRKTYGWYAANPKKK